MIDPIDFDTINGKEKLYPSAFSRIELFETAVIVHTRDGVIEYGYTTRVRTGTERVALTESQFFELLAKL